MKNDNSNIFVKFEYLITSETKKIEEITQMLEIEPTRAHNKGDAVYDKPDNKSFRILTLWAINPVSEFCEEIDIERNISFFRKLLEPKYEEILKLKNNDNFECRFNISIHTEDTGYGFIIEENDLLFITKIASMFQVDVITVSDMQQYLSGTRVKYKKY